MYDLRRNDYDVTNTVQVSSTAAVTAAVRELFAAAWPTEPFDKVQVAFEDFDRLYTGRMPGYHAVDTVYHDRQHSLDMTLAMARLMVGYEQSVESRLGLKPLLTGVLGNLLLQAACGVSPEVLHGAVEQFDVEQCADAVTEFLEGVGPREAIDPFAVEEEEREEPFGEHLL